MLFKNGKYLGCVPTVSLAQYTCVHCNCTSIIKKRGLIICWFFSCGLSCYLLVWKKISKQFGNTFQKLLF